MFKRLFYRWFGVGYFVAIYRYDITTGSVAEMYSSDGKMLTTILLNLKPNNEYSLKSNQFVYDEFTNRLDARIKLDPNIVVDLPRNIYLNTIDKRQNALCY